MRIYVEIDDRLMRDALQATGMETEREVVEEALRTCYGSRNKQSFASSEATSIGEAISTR